MAQREFYPALEGIRGLSLIAVLLFHAGNSWLPGGFLGVSTFFTLSGFLITGLLISEWERKGTIGLVNFWSRRLRRLLPASLVVLIGIAVLSGPLADLTQRERLNGDGLAALFYVSNWWLIGSGADYDSLMGSPSLIQHFWSLSVEEQYYFFYPLVAYVILRGTSGSRAIFGAVLVAATLLSFGWMAGLAATNISTARLYYGTDTRAGELLAGGALALWLTGRPALRGTGVRRLATLLGVVGLAVSVAGWVLARVETPTLYAGGIALYACATLAILVAAVQPSGPVRALLAWSPLRWVGRISYGAYVYHWPIFLWVRNDALRFSLTLAIAQVSYRFLEEPIRTGHLVLGWRRFVLPPLAIAGVAGAFVLVRPNQPVAEFILTPLASRDAAPARKLRIAIAGDSLARDIGEGLELWAQQTELAVIENLAIRGCGIARGAWPEKDVAKRSSCDRWPELTRQRLVKFKPDVVVAVTAGWDLLDRQLAGWAEPRAIGDAAFDRWLIQQYVEAYQVFSSTGARVVWLTTPCLRDPFGTTQGPWDPKRQRRMNESILPALLTERGDGLTLLDLDAVVCPGGQFTRSLHGIENFRRDGVHFSEPGSLWVGGWLGQQLLPAPGVVHAEPTAPEEARP